MAPEKFPRAAAPYRHRRESAPPSPSVSKRWAWRPPLPHSKLSAHLSSAPAERLWPNTPRGICENSPTAVEFRLPKKLDPGLAASALHQCEFVELPWKNLETCLLPRREQRYWS